ncbi:MAG: hypothetical protein ACREFL_12115 [Stellaceae bacterium]
MLAHPDSTTRQQVLDENEPITHRDPVRIGQLFWGIALGFVPGGGGARLVGPAARAAEEAASEFWTLGWAARGQKIEGARTAEMPGMRLPNSFPVVDHLADGGAVTSIKSIDLNAATYQDAGRLAYRINDYIGKLADFQGAKYGNVTIKPKDITGRVLDIVVPKGSMTAAQKTTLDIGIRRASDAGIVMRITPF